MNSDLSKRAKQHAEGLRKDKEEQVGGVDPCHEQARRDLPEWKRRIEKQISSKYGGQTYTCVHAGHKDDGSLNSTEWRLGWFGYKPVTIDAQGFRYDEFRNHYIAELQRLLGDGFKVYGSGATRGPVITSALPYPHDEIVSDAYVAVSWGD